MKKEKITHLEQVFRIIKKYGFLLPRLESKHQYIRRLKQATYYGTITRLETRGLVRKEKIDGKTRVVLTKQGQRFSFRAASAQIPRTDFLSTIIIFDIPLAQKRESQFFRRKLVQHGFTLLQKSVLISRNAYSKELLELEQELGIAKYITHLSGRVDYLTAK